VSILPQQSIHTLAKAVGEMDNGKTWMLESSPDIEVEGLKCCLCQVKVDLVWLSLTYVDSLTSWRRDKILAKLRL